MADNNINSIKRAIGILNLYKRGNRYLGITEISREMVLPKATVYRILNTLVEEGWLVKHKQTGRYRLGFEPLTIANLVREQYEAKDIVLQEMAKLKQESGETVILSVYAKGSGICIEKMESDNPIKLTSQPGELIPLHAGASGKVLLAFAPEEDIEKILGEDLETFTSHTPQNPEELRRQIRKIRQDGYAVSYSESNSGAVAIGAPVLDGHQNMIYGLSVAGPAERMEAKDIDLLVRQVCDAARRISESLRLLD